MLHAIIMAGGSGTRFWPASRKMLPKQLLALAGDRTMIQATADRLSGVTSPQRTMVITSRDLVDPIATQLPELPRASIVGEPSRRDTAPCIGLTAVLVSADDPDAIMLVCPSDHVIADHAAFAAAVERGVKILNDRPGAIVTFGIRPSYPAESFGYIQSAESLASDSGAYVVRQFREKPDRATAESYMEAGNFYWNSGIFLWRASTILDSLKKHEPEMSRHLQSIAAAIGQPDYESVLEREFNAIVGKSIDYAVMERHTDVIVMEAPFDWDDVGSWRAVSRLHPADADGNVVVGKHLGIDTKGCIIHGDGQHMIVTIDAHDLIVVQTADATLVAPKSSEERVREIVKRLREAGREDLI